MKLEVEDRCEEEMNPVAKSNGGREKGVLNEGPGLPTSEDNEYKEKQALIKHLIKESFR